MTLIRGPGGVESGNILAEPDFVSNFNPWPGEPLLESGVSLIMPSFASDFDVLQLPDFVSVIDPGLGKISPESGDKLAMSDFDSDFDPGSGEPLLQWGISLNMPNFAGDVDILQVPNFVSVRDPGPGKISPESGGILAMSDVVSDFVPGPGEPLLQSRISLSMPNLAGDVDILQVPNFVSVSDPWPGRLPGVRGYVGNVEFRQ